MSIRPGKTFSSRRAQSWLLIAIGSILIAILAGMNQQAAGLWRFTPETVYLADIQVPFWRNFSFETEAIGAIQPPQDESPTQWTEALSLQYQFGIVRIPSHGADRVDDHAEYVDRLRSHIEQVRASGESSWMMQWHWLSVVTLLAIFAALLGIIGFLRQCLLPRSEP